MKKKPQSKDERLSVPETAPPSCWERDPNAQALRVELADGTFLILPYPHLGFAKLSSDEAAETLLLTFSSHEITIVGRKLRDLALAVQKLSADWIREVPKRYSQLVEQDSPVIETILVKELAEENRDAQSSAESE